MNLDELKKHLEEAEKHKPTIPEDYVCVIHPVVEYELRKLHRSKVGVPDDDKLFALLWWDWLPLYTGRKTFVELRAPMLHAEYMSVFTYHAKYPPAFVSKSDEDNDQ